MRLRNLILVLMLGTLAALLPALASSETTPTVSAKSGSGPYGEPYSWSPAQQTVAQDGSVTFNTGSTAAPHGIVWVNPPAQPTCTGTVPVGETSYAEHWNGSCSFSTPGVYHFHCSVHTTEMIGTITVTAAGTTTTMSAPAPSPTPTTTTPPVTPKPLTPAHLTRAQKLARALKACKKQKGKQRKACIKRAHKKYGPKRK